MTTEIRTIDIKGTAYATVNARLKYFRENCENYRLISEILSNENGVVTMKASVLNEKGEVLATGHASEKEGSSFINKTSHIENCETSAWGRALGNFGIGIDAAVASYEEVANALEQRKPPKTKKEKEGIHADKETIRKENVEELLGNCYNLDEAVGIWWKLTKEQQADSEIKEWFTLAKAQIMEGVANG